MLSIVLQLCKIHLHLVICNVFYLLFCFSKIELHQRKHYKENNPKAVRMTAPPACGFYANLQTFRFYFLKTDFFF